MLSVYDGQLVFSHVKEYDIKCEDTLCQSPTVCIVEPLLYNYLHHHKPKPYFGLLYPVILVCTLDLYCQRECPIMVKGITYFWSILHFMGGIYNWIYLFCTNTVLTECYQVSMTTTHFSHSYETHPAL